VRRVGTAGPPDGVGGRLAVPDIDDPDDGSGRGPGDTARHDRRARSGSANGGARCGAAERAVIAAGPASAHGGSAGDDAYYQAAVTSVSPAVPGVTVRVDQHAQWVEVASTRPDPVVVQGYLGEPYLRITSAGVAENQRSLSAVLNRSMFAEIVPTEQNNPNAAPVWKTISGQRSARWHDHRVHWMGAQRPPAVAADPTRPQPVGTWVVRVTAGTTPMTVTGTLSWRGGEGEGGGGVGRLVAGLARTLIWVEVLAVVLGGGMVTVDLVRRRRRRAKRQTGSGSAAAASPSPSDTQLSEMA
jgi:hypothetical protein